MEVEFKANTSKYEKGLARMRATTEKLGQQIEGSMTGGKFGFLKAAGGAGLLAGGIVAVGAAATKMARDSISWGSTISDQALEAQTSIKDLQALFALGLEVGRGPDTFLQALRAINTRTAQAGQGAKEYTEIIKNLGYSVEDFTKLSGSEKLEAIGKYWVDSKDKSSAYADIVKMLGEDAAPKLQEALKALGEQGLGKLNEKFTESGQIIEDSIISALDKSEDAINRFSDRVSKAWTKTMGMLAGSIMSNGDKGDITLAKQLKITANSMANDLGAKNIFDDPYGKNDPVYEEVGAIQEDVKLSDEAINSVNVEEFKKGAKNIFSKISSSFKNSFFGSNSNDMESLIKLGWDDKKTNPTEIFSGKAGIPVTSLAAVGGGGVINDQALQVQRMQVDFLRQIAENTGSQTKRDNTARLA